MNTNYGSTSIRLRIPVFAYCAMSLLFNISIFHAGMLELKVVALVQLLFVVAGIILLRASWPLGKHNSESHKPRNGVLEFALTLTFTLLNFVWLFVFAIYVVGKWRGVAE